jgi:hypothetical protein
MLDDRIGPPVALILSPLIALLTATVSMLIIGLY